MRRGRGRVRMEELPRRLSLSTTGKSGSSRLLTLAVWLRYLQYCRYRQQQYLWLWREYSGTSRKPAWAVYDFLFPFPVPVGRRPPGGGFASRKFYGLWLWLSPSRATGLRLLLHNNASIRVDRVSLIDYSMYCMYGTVQCKRGFWKDALGDYVHRRLGHRWSITLHREATRTCRSKQIWLMGNIGHGQWTLGTLQQCTVPDCTSSTTYVSRRRGAMTTARGDFSRQRRMI